MLLLVRCSKTTLARIISFPGDACNQKCPGSLQAKSAMSILHIGVHAGKSGCPRGIAGKILGGGVSVLEVHRQNLSVLVVLCKQFLLANPSGTDSLSVPGVHRQNLSVVGALCKQKCLTQGVLQAKSLSRGGGAVDRNVCPRGYCRQNFLSQGCSAGRSVCLRGASDKVRLS